MITHANVGTSFGLVRAHSGDGFDVGKHSVIVATVADANVGGGRVLLFFRVHHRRRHDQAAHCRMVLVVIVTDRRRRRGRRQHVVQRADGRRVRRAVIVVRARNGRSRFHLRFAHVHDPRYVFLKKKRKNKSPEYTIKQWTSSQILIGDSLNKRQ